MIAIPVAANHQSRPLPTAPAQPPLQLKPVVYFTKFQPQPTGTHQMHRPSSATAALVPALVYDTRPVNNNGGINTAGGQSYGITPMPPPLAPTHAPLVLQPASSQQLQPQSNFNNIKVISKFLCYINI